MKEIRDIVSAYDEAQRQGRQTALATVVQVEGSAYRRPGARMLITDDGRLTGAISGGCLEGDALKKALHAMATKRAILVTYDTTDDDDAKLGIGLGCNGIIHILIEPIDSNCRVNPIQLLRRILCQRQKLVIVTLFVLEDRKAFQPGTCLLYAETGELISNISGLPLINKLTEDTHSVLANQSSKITTYTIDKTVFTAYIGYVSPAVSLIIAGAGNDAIPLVNMAHLVGWEITVIDGRPNYATNNRFPAAQHVIVAKPAMALSHFEIDDQTVFVLMTHNYNYDMAMLEQLMDSATSYIGVLGPKKKLQRMLDEIEEHGKVISSKQQAKVFGPVGLDIGAENAEEIAISIVAEIKSVLAKKNALSLKNKKGPIHAKSLTVPLLNRSA